MSGNIDAAKHAVSEEAEAKGAYRRKRTEFHNRIKAGLPAGSDGVADEANPSVKLFPAEPGRYHIYVSKACPWAHRTLVLRALKGLEDVISVSVVNPYLRGFKDRSQYVGWHFGPLDEDDQKYHADLAAQDFNDPLHDDTATVWDLYKKNVPDYPNQYLSVPIFFDKKTDRIINNESSEIIEFLNSEFNEFAKNPDLDLNPEDLRDAMKEVNDLVYPNVNDGVYKCGFARSQEAYQEAFENLFNALDTLEERLGRSRFLCGDRMTLSDIRLWTTLLRFDPVYVTHFKTNKKRLVDYPNLFGFTRDVYQTGPVRETVDLSQIKYHYYKSHPDCNPKRFVPLGPEIDYETPHGRDREY